MVQSHGSLTNTPAVTKPTGLPAVPLELCGQSHSAACCKDQYSQGKCSQLRTYIKHTKGLSQTQLLNIAHGTKEHQLHFTLMQETGMYDCTVHMWYYTVLSQTSEVYTQQVHARCQRESISTVCIGYLGKKASFCRMLLCSTRSTPVEGTMWQGEHFSWQAFSQSTPTHVHTIILFKHITYIGTDTYHNIHRHRYLPSTVRYIQGLN